MKSLGFLDRDRRHEPVCGLTSACAGAHCLVLSAGLDPEATTSGRGGGEAPTEGCLRIRVHER
jgi:hypothetical protein